MVCRVSTETNNQTLSPSANELTLFGEFEGLSFLHRQCGRGDVEFYKVKHWINIYLQTFLTIPTFAFVVRNFTHYI